MPRMPSPCATWQRRAAPRQPEHPRLPCRKLFPAPSRAVRSSARTKTPSNASTTLRISASSTRVTVVMPASTASSTRSAAAFRLLQLKHVDDQALEQRREIAERYRRLLAASLASSASAWYPDLRQQRLFPDPGGSRFSAFRVTSCTSACATGMCWCGATSTHSSATSPCTIRCPRRRPPIFRWRGRFPAGAVACRSIPGWPPQTSSSSPA